MIHRWVHCDQHGGAHLIRPDGTCWCGCIDDLPNVGRYGTLLETVGDKHEDHVKAIQECKAKGLWIYSDKDYK